MDVESIRIDASPVDAELTDDGFVGPELAWLARHYVDSPRALVWQHPSSDWRVLALALPLTSRLTLLANPVFTQLARTWGLAVRFVGVDRDGHVHDFRALLSDRTLRLLIDALVADRAASGGAGTEGLDVLFAALADEMLTRLPAPGAAARAGHLDREHRLESGLPDSLFDRTSRFPDFLAALREALRGGLIDVELYGRALRSIDLREAAVEQRLAALIEDALDPVVLAKLARAGVGRHLGAYNWLHASPRHAAARAHVLARLPSFAPFLADALLPLLALAHAGDSGADPAIADARDDHEAGAVADLPAHDPSAEPRSGPGSRALVFDLRRRVVAADSARALWWAGLLQRAIDAGQDRAVIGSLAGRFGVPENLLRRLWREPPPGLGQPPAWQLPEVLRVLAQWPERQWPASRSGWEALLERAVPAGL